MLYMHCGWVRTGTSSLQAALVAHREKLAASGVVYPDQWQLDGINDNHQGVIELLKSDGGQAELERFRSQLEALAGPQGAVLLSAESFTYWLTGENRDTLLSFLALIREKMPVTCIWTLRNVVDVAGSMYLRHVLIQHNRPRPPAEFIRALDTAGSWPADLFAGHRRLEGAVDDTVYLRYARSGFHSRELLRAVGVAPDVSASIERQLRQGHRLNARLSHKGAIAVLHRDEVSARAGIEISKAPLTRALYRGELTFDDDGPCRLFAGDAIAKLHRRALSAARDSGFAPYLEFFGADELDTSPPVELDPDALSDDDLDRLARVIGRNDGTS